ncbi:hypothetical protein SPRG_07393 [Saprolegnia parasitica CBS 223.65]|uniref:mRNA capping enzyme adenylation domain-containing protein n=1 Tax=Saprolegnia parasitica (strain CBS 223.65) TaxID=695850 RepID=A0A067CAL1_SAPPC|nr:hypothetical protein SPRG_07393 [Saprolegnia parasitica CBS 223.65]KDO27794.1 hypothetical protein SPRG_07393 [Saprolegnia parasitica CBS 223.65]|eukprot:XP_012201569.1 hypothetical protein SPRG_07393 [Saprolegnia parasitica CBS 223.65]
MAVPIERIQALLKQQPRAKASGGRKLLPWSPTEWTAWQKTPMFGAVVKNLLPVRAPLAPLYEIHYDESFAGGSPSDLMEGLIQKSARGDRINVTTVIDASGNGCYYHDAREWDDWDVQCVKLPPFEDDVPPKAIVKAFCDAVQKHVAANEPDTHVAVFGGYGYNVAGFLIVSYLVEHGNMHLLEAIDLYKKTNAPGIYSVPCLQALYRRYYAMLKSPESRLSVPAPPSWDTSAAHVDPSLTIGSEVLTDDDKATPFVRSAALVVAQPVVAAAASAPVVHRPKAFAPPPFAPPPYVPPPAPVEVAKTKKRKIRTWEDDVEPFPFGTPVPEDSKEHEKLVSVVQQLTGVDGFPGSETMSLTKIHIRDPALDKPGSLTKSYLVTWRARGIRCLLLGLKDGVYLVSRRMTFTKVNVKLPRKRALHENTDMTLVDGVLVQDQDGDTVVPRYLAYDIIAWENTPVWKGKLEKRLQCLQNEIILPRKSDKHLDLEAEPFRVRMKDHFRLEKAEHVLRTFIPRITHDVEGLIFTPKNAPYGVGGYECDEPQFKFVVDSAASMMGGLDGSLTENQLLQYIKSIP